jgi:NADH dehydrogenase
VSVEGTIASRLSIASGPGGRLRVAADLSVPGHQDTYAVGDAAAVPWGPGSKDPDAICPQLAQVALQSGAHAGRQVLLRLEGRPTRPFRYHDKGIMATVGRRAAITQFPRGAVIRGTLGWLAWLGLHIVYLIGFRNRIVVLVNWSWRYLSWGSGPRIIIDDKRRFGDELGPGPGMDPDPPPGPS